MDLRRRSRDMTYSPPAVCSNFKPVGPSFGSIAILITYLMIRVLYIGSIEKLPIDVSNGSCMHAGETYARS